jgi:hypothetical protein
MRLTISPTVDVFLASLLIVSAWNTSHQRTEMDEDWSHLFVDGSDEGGLDPHPEGHSNVEELVKED